MLSGLVLGKERRDNFLVHTLCITADLEMVDVYGYDRDGPSERSRWTPLARLLFAGHVTQEVQKALSAKEKFNRWMVNEGYRRVWVDLCVLSILFLSFDF